MHADEHTHVFENNYNYNKGHNDGNIILIFLFLRSSPPRRP